MLRRPTQLRPAYSALFALFALFAMAVLAAPRAVAEPEPGATREVVVKDIRAPELKRYRAMLAGLDAFEANHALAPAAAEVRFRLRPKSGKPDADLDELKLRIALDEGSIPLPLAPDHSFVLPRSAQALRENGDLVLNKRKGDYRWQADVYSAGLPPDMRRLGDLRLECRVEVAVIKAEISFWINALINSILLTSDWCSIQNVHFSTRSARRLEAAWLVHGEQRIALELSDDGMGFIAPSGNTRYPDGTLIALDYADAPTPASASASAPAPAPAPDMP